MEIVLLSTLSIVRPCQYYDYCEVPPLQHLLHLSHLGCLLRLRCRVSLGGDSVDDESVRNPEVLQSVLQTVALQCHQPLLPGQNPEPAARVGPELNQVEVQTQLHPGQVDAGDGD